MAYGVKNPQKILEALGDAAIPMDSFDVCPICGQEVRTDGSHVALGRIRFPAVHDESVQTKIILGCQNCYVKQLRCNFYTFDELRATRVVNVKPGRGRKSKAIETTYDEETKILLELKRGINALIKLKRQNSCTSHDDESLIPEEAFIDALIESHSSEIDQDAKDSALKSKLTPEEWWNGLTTREILDVTAEKRGQRYDEDLGAFVDYEF